MIGSKETTMWRYELKMGGFCLMMELIKVGYVINISMSELSHTSVLLSCLVFNRPGVSGPGFGPLIPGLF